MSETCKATCIRTVMQTAYSYNTLNRLSNVAMSRGSTLASYAYTLVCRQQDPGYGNSVAVR